MLIPPRTQHNFQGESKGLECEEALEVPDSDLSPPAGTPSRAPLNADVRERRAVFFQDIFPQQQLPCESELWSLEPHRRGQALIILTVFSGGEGRRIAGS